MSDLDDIDDRRRSAALFRHAIIGELDGPMARGDLSRLVQELASRTYRLKNGRERRFSERTLWSWWSAYKKGGLFALVPGGRQDRGQMNALTSDILDLAVALRKEIPARSTSTLIDIMVRMKKVVPGQVARATLDRHLAVAGASRRALKALGDKRYIRLLFERPNQFWVGDYHEAPILYDPATGRFRTVHLCAFIDHFSRLVVHAQWYSNERIATLEDSYKKAICKRGVSDKTYVDNARVYHSDAFTFAVDLIGSRLVHSKANTSEGRGLIERWNRTVAEQFEPEARAAQIDDIERLNLLFEAWLEERYHRQRHESTGESPLDRFAASSFVPRYPDPVVVQDIFRVRVKRRVHPKTSTVEIDGVPFLVEAFLRRRWVRVHYDPHRLDDVLVFFRGKKVQRAFPQPVNEKPQPRPERPVASPPAFDYLSALRADYDRRLVAQVKHLRLSDFTPLADFTLADFLGVCTQLLGKDLTPYERDELSRCFHAVGPFSEATTRLALEHTLKLRGRGLHVTVYTHYLKTFQLAALKGFKETP